MISDSHDEQVLSELVTSLKSSVSLQGYTSSWGAQRVMDSYEAHGLVLPPLAKDLLSIMMHPDPSLRPTLEEILLHPFLECTRDGSC